LPHANAPFVVIADNRPVMMRRCRSKARYRIERERLHKSCDTATIPPGQYGLLNDPIAIEVMLGSAMFQYFIRAGSQGR
jgi:hypothetical protein